MLKKIFDNNVRTNKQRVLDKLKNWYESSNVRFWIAGYCVFKYLAQVYGTVDFNKWNDKLPFYDNAQFLKLSDEEKQKAIVSLFNNSDGQLTEEQHVDMLFYAKL